MTDSNEVATDPLATAKRGARRVARDAMAGSARVAEAANGELGLLLEDIDDALQKVGNVAGVDAASLQERVQGVLRAGKGRVSAAADGAKRLARDAASSADDYVRARPWQSIGVAALIGAAVGYLIARRD